MWVSVVFKDKYVDTPCIALLKNLKTSYFCFTKQWTSFQYTFVTKEKHRTFQLQVAAWREFHQLKPLQICCFPLVRIGKRTR